MSSDIATQEYPGAAPMEMPQMQYSPALQTMQSHMQAIDSAYHIAKVMCSTNLVPKSYKNHPEDGAAAIMYGMELGLNPIQSLQQVVVIQGKPTIEARTMVALLKMRGYKFETVESSTQRVTVRGVSPRGETEESTWTMDRVSKAGLMKNALYSKIPEQMLYARAATEVCRRLAPDVLLGISYAKEEMDIDMPDTGPVSAQAERLDVSRAQQPPMSVQQETMQNAVMSADMDSDDDLEGLCALVRSATSLEEFHASWPIIEQDLKVNPAHKEKLHQVWKETEASLSTNAGSFGGEQWQQ